MGVHAKAGNHFCGRRLGHMQETLRASAFAVATLCLGAPHRARRGTKSRSASLETVEHFHMGSSESQGSSAVDFELRCPTRAARCRPGPLTLGSDNDPHALGGEQCGEQRGPQPEAQHNNPWCKPC